MLGRLLDTALVAVGGGGCLILIQEVLQDLGVLCRASPQDTWSIRSQLHPQLYSCSLRIFRVLGCFCGWGLSMAQTWRAACSCLQLEKSLPSPQTQPCPGHALHYLQDLQGTRKRPLQPAPTDRMCAQEMTNCLNIF